MSEAMSGATCLAPIDELRGWRDDWFADFRSSLSGAGYSEAILELTERVAPGMFDHLRRPLVIRALEKRGDAAAILARLFGYDDAVDSRTLEGLFGAQGLDTLLSSGVLTVDPSEDDRIRSLFRMLPMDGMWILSDRFDAGPDATMGPGPTTSQLVRLLPDRIDGSVLDVGCGAGTLALAAAARGAGRVIGADLNPRALEIARFNARLNGLGVEFREGDLLESVRGESFALIVGQPPYVPHPPGLAATTYLHGGVRGDEIAMRLIEGLPRVLGPAGRALILMDSAARSDDLLSSRIRAALREAPIDLLVLAAPGASADLQSIGYALLDSMNVGPEYGTAVRRYRDHMDALGIDEFRHCLVLFRRHSGDPGSGGRFTIQLRVRSLPRSAAALDEILARLDIAALDDDSLRHHTVRAASRARWVEERMRPDPACEPTSYVRFSPEDILLDQEISDAGRILTETLEVGETIDDAITRYAAICDATPEEVRGQVLDFVRLGLSRGMLEPARSVRGEDAPA